MSRLAQAQELADAINAVEATDPVVTAVLDPALAVGAATDGVAVVVGPPVVTFDLPRPSSSNTWILYVFAKHNSYLTQWQRIDAALETVRAALPGVGEARVSEFALPDSGPAPLAYEVTYETAY